MPANIGDFEPISPHKKGLPSITAQRASLLCTIFLPNVMYKNDYWGLASIEMRCKNLP
jgi:hypothetical protein